MTVGLSNASKRARNYGQIVNQDWRGGGNKKAGFPYIIGRGWRTNIAFGTMNAGTPTGHCVGLRSLQTLCFTNTVHQTRPIGGDIKNTYWH